MLFKLTVVPYNYFNLNTNCLSYTSGVMDSTKEDNNIIFATTPASVIRDYTASSSTANSLNRHNSYKETKSTTDLRKSIFSYIINRLVYLSVR